MSHESVSKAVLLALNTQVAGATYDSVYGGETLLNRALVALSKSGVRLVTIICHEGQREKIACMIKAIHHRVSCDCEIVEVRSRELLSATIARVVEEWAGKPLINSPEASSNRKHVLRQAQHERIIFHVPQTPSVHPELVEGRTEDFSTASKLTSSLLGEAWQPAVRSW